MTVGPEVGASVVGEVGVAVVGALEGAPVVGAAEGAEDGATEGALVVGAAVGEAVAISYVDSHSQTHELTMLHLSPLDVLVPLWVLNRASPWLSMQPAGTSSRSTTEKESISTRVRTAASHCVLLAMARHPARAEQPPRSL